jgi:hypothetical protein
MKYIYKKLKTNEIIKTPGPVQGHDHPGHFLKKNLKQRRFSKKTKVNGLQPSF